MTFEEFKSSVNDEVPQGNSPALRALWYDARGDWERAHAEVQDASESAAAWVHAYLHRKEGDHGNARYWYGRAGRRYTDVPLDAEWEEITSALLASGGSSEP